jgi:hypothetical protein
MIHILKNFEEKYGSLKKKGLRIEGMNMIDPKRKKHVILISKPFIFDNRNLPKSYEGVEIKAKIEGELPQEFKPVPDKKEYTWAPRKFELFVDRCAGELRKKFNNPEMSRQDMLDALAFGNFEEHKRKSIQLMQDGKIPPFELN